MKVLKSLLAVTAASAVVLGGVNSQAIPVSGVITFQGTATVTSTAVTSWDTHVASVVGFGGYVTTGDAVAMATPWYFNSSAVSALWSVDNFTFNLNSSSVIYQAFGAVLVSGTGTISGNGYDTTAGTWSFFSSVPRSAGTITTPIFSFSVAGGRVLNSNTNPGTTPVPDGGTTLILLGMALSIVAVLRRVFRKELA